MRPWLLRWDIWVDALENLETPNSSEPSEPTEVTFFSWLEGSYLKIMLPLLPPSILLSPAVYHQTNN